MFERYRQFMEGLGEWRWALWGAGGMAGIVLAVWLLDQFWKRFMVPLTARTRAKLDEILARNSGKPILAVAATGAAMLLFSWIVHQARVRAEAVLAGQPGALAAHWTGSFGVTVVGGVLYVAVVLAVCALGYSLVASVCDWYLLHVASKTSTTLDDQFVPMFRRIFKVVALFVAATVILGHFDVQVTALLGAAGFASLAVALAAQETVANMISGFTILLDRPFRVGDRVELADGVVGDVTDIGLRTTKILSFDSTQLIIPNKEISSARIINHSYPDPKVKIRKKYTVAYGSDVAAVKRVLSEVAAAHPKVLKEPAPGVYFTEFEDSALAFMLVCWIADYRDKFATVDDLNVEVNRRFAAERIEIPFPQRDLHIRSGLEKLERAAREAS